MGALDIFGCHRYDCLAWNQKRTGSLNTWKKQVIYVDDMLQETNLHYTSAVIFPTIMKMTNPHLSFFQSSWTLIILSFKLYYH